MFFGVGGPELLLILVLVGVVALVLVTTDPWITASQTLFVEGLSAADLQQPMRGLLGSTRSSELTYTGGSFVLVVRRIPGWILLGVVLAFPFGLLLLFVRRSEALLVAVKDVDGGAEVRVIGHTKQSVIKTLAKGLGSLRTPVNVR
jgi:hypothetical protein